MAPAQQQLKAQMQLKNMSQLAGVPPMNGISFFCGVTKKNHMVCVLFAPKLFSLNSSITIHSEEG